ncbi:MAG: acyl carrier protein [bacterium]
MEISKEALTRNIRAMIAEIAERDEEEIQENHSFVEDLGFDSMMALEILAKLEKQYKIKIPEEELTKLDNLNQTVELVLKYSKSH